MAKKLLRIARNKYTGDRYIECPPRYWKEFLEAWYADHTLPAPMIVGHIMFRGKASRYQVITVNKALELYHNTTRKETHDEHPTR